MAKVSVPLCDVCGGLDSEGNPVKRVSVCGVLRDMCETDRLVILTAANVPHDHAVRQVQAQNAGTVRRGYPGLTPVARDPGTESETAGGRSPDGAGGASRAAVKGRKRADQS